MTLRKPFLPILLATVAFPFAAHAQETTPPASEQEEGEQPSGGGTADVLPEDEEAIVVTANRPRGEVIGDIPPEITLDARDIRAYGASSLEELLEALAPQTQSGRGRDGGQPVTLLNGRRISGFREIRDIPPEAIERVDILPEEVALKYGYRADQRVVNFVTRERFRAITGELDYGQPTAGGRSSQEVDVNILRINQNGRWSIDAEYERETALLESERDIIQEASDSFALGGNVGALTPGGEIDPALSGLAGETVTSAGVPSSVGSGVPVLGDFLGGVNVDDEGRYRTLSGASEEFEVNGTYSRYLGSVSATLNASYEGSNGENLQGLPQATLTLPSGNPFSPFASDVLLYRSFDALGPLTRSSRSRNAHAGLSINGALADWQWSGTANYDRNISRSRTASDLDITAIQSRIDAGDPALNPFGDLDVAFSPVDRARSVSSNANAQFVMNGSVAALPAGEVSTTFRVGGSTSDFESETLRDGEEDFRKLGRDNVNAQANVDLPIASVRDGVLDAIGDLSLNANAEVEHLSDFGTLWTYGYGLNWSPIDEVRVIASYTSEDGAPSVNQLGDPVIENLNARVFDFLRGETVDITRISGGNPDLVADNRRVMKIGVNVEPWEDKDLSIRADYIRTRTRDPIASFPTATPEIEAAFPERFVRDGDGRLLSIDSRPVNFARAESQELRWGINFSKPLQPSAAEQREAEERRARRAERRAARAEATAASPPPADGQAASVPNANAGPPAGGGNRGFRGRGGRQFGGGGEGRIQLSLFHTLRIQDEVLIREGVPELDFLNGSAAGNGGGRPRHELQLRAGIFKNGFGARLNGNWQSGTRIDGAPATGGGTGSDLIFSDLTTFDLRVFADLSQQESLVRNYPILRGTRVSLSLNNIFDSRLNVRDELGVTPISYQPYLIDPIGRSVQVSVRKLFF